MSEALEESVRQLERSVAVLQDSLQTLAQNSQQTQYLSDKMFLMRKQHVLATEFDMERATKDLNEEIEPLVKPLQDKLAKSLERLQRQVVDLEKTYTENELTLRETRQRTENLAATDGDADSHGDEDVIIGPATDDQLSQLRSLNSQIEQKRKELESLD